MSTNNNVKEKSKGSLLWRFSQRFNFAAENIIPDPLVFCLILTVILFISGVLFTAFSPVDMLNAWFKGIWSQIGFAFQMSFMVVTCSVAARSRQVKNFLSKVAKLAKSPIVAIILLMIFGYISSFMNWAFGTIATPVLAMLLSKNVKGLHFPILVAAGYSTMILGQCWGPSASVYALIASPDHFLVDQIGVITQDVSVYNPMNTILFFILALGTIGLTILSMPPKDQVIAFESFDDEVEVVEKKNTTKLSFADRMNGSRILMWLIGLGGLVVIVSTIMEKGFLGSLSLNFVIFIFLIANFFLYSTPTQFVNAYRNNMSLATDVMIQFPFYGGISGMMMDSGLGQEIVGAFTSIATADTLPLLSYYSASILNLFIPSQGGQFIVQGPILMEAAQQLNANVPHVINAFVFGDEATNLLQPLYVIPALAIVKMKLKDVWGYMAFIWLFWFIITTIGLLVLPAILG